MGAGPRGVLDLIKENWEEGSSDSKNEVQYMDSLGVLSREHLHRAQESQRRLYDRGTRLRDLTPGDKVLVLLPTSSTKLLAKWQGPFVVTGRVWGRGLRGSAFGQGRKQTGLPHQPP